MTTFCPTFLRCHPVRSIDSIILLQSNLYQWPPHQNGHHCIAATSNSSQCIYCLLKYSFSSAGYTLVKFWNCLRYSHNLRWQHWSGAGTCCVYLRFHATSVLWNVWLTWKFQTSLCLSMYFRGPILDSFKSCRKLELCRCENIPWVNSINEVM